ncbi:rod shape-determining protein MreC [Clostridium tarantellae]|uniref:Cell shape-determining protein MreC n=1 Tax=Clostridium tarantellae TaxID=39493 RepID=A0A6I1MG38_9CLOT|nr:rod shape-determining protein MreC [Clostridium tarantellae]MPQ42496.1 rod shape-determining protein MreC [Clostridium tarantellae]
MKFLKNKLAVTVIVLSVTFLSIIIFSVKNGSGNIVSGGIGSALNPVQKVVYAIGDKISGVIDFFYNFSSVKAENDELKKKNIELQNKLVGYENFKRENENLKSMLDFQNKQDQYKYVGANIIGKNEGYIIDKGTKDGVYKDMPIVVPEGLVGVVTEASTNWAKVKTLIDENIAVAGIVERSRDVGIVKGYTDSNNTPLAKISNLNMNSDIKEGDVILTTSDVGGYYPKDIRIGEVVSVKEDKVNVMKTAVIKPYVNFNKLEQVFVVVPKNIRDIKDIKYD